VAGTILIPRKYTAREIKRADVARTEFRPNRYTSGSANLDDMIALRKAVILCDQHARKFKPRAAHYELHPAPNMKRVQGRCDVCKVFGLSWLYLNAADALEQRKLWHRARVAMEYGTLYSG
jgi:predicted metal-dependent hydrolase